MIVRQAVRADVHPVIWLSDTTNGIFCFVRCV